MSITYLPLANTTASPVTDGNGRSRAGVSLLVRARGTTTPVQAYATASNATPLTLGAALVTDALGQIPGFVASPQSVDLFDPATNRIAQVEIIASADAGGVAGIPSFNARTGPITLSKADVTGTGLAAADVGAATTGALTTETTRATAAEGTNATAIATNATAISTETTRATAAEASAQANAIAASEQVLIRTAVKTGTYVSVPGDAVPWDISGGNGIHTLPTAPADKTRISSKIVTISGTQGSTTLAINAGGSDTFNKVAGSVTLTLAAQFQGVVLQYDLATHVWQVQAADTPLGVAGGALQADAAGLLPAAKLPAVSAIGTPHAISAAGTSISASGAYLLDASTAAFAQNLPAASTFSGVLWLEAVTSGATNLVTVTPNGADTIEGFATLPLGPNGSGAPYQAVTLVSDGVSKWRIV